MKWKCREQEDEEEVALKENSVGGKGHEGAKPSEEEFWGEKAV